MAMRIDFECSGGFANLRLAYRADTDTLSQELAGELAQLVNSSGFFELDQASLASKAAGPPDVFFYRLSISAGNRQQTLSFNDVTAPVALHPLLALLRRLAVDQKLHDS